MRNIKIDIGEDGRHVFDTSHLLTEAEKEAAALAVVERLVQFNLHSGDCLPSLFSSSVRYRVEVEYEGYADAFECVRRGYADAVEIVAWRVAELRHSGDDPGAKPILCREPRGDGPGFIYYMAKVLRSDGTIENPVEDIRRRS